MTDPAPPALWRAPNIRMAWVDEDIIILDVQDDRYDGLLDMAGAINLDADGALGLTEAGLGDALVGAGLAAPTPPPPSLPILRARRDLPPSQDASLGEVLRAGLVQLTAALVFRRKAFRDLIEARPASPETQAIDEARVARLVRAARAARIWIPYEGECLKRSFQLRRFLASQGVATDWIFGVRTWPFSAHCWLQIGDLVVGDRLERISRYTPILRA